MIVMILQLHVTNVKVVLGVGDFVVRKHLRGPGPQEALYLHGKGGEGKEKRGMREGGRKRQERGERGGRKRQERDERGGKEKKSQGRERG